MGLSAVLGIGSSLIGASSASKAAKAQEAAANSQIALQKEMYDETTARYAPFYDQGQDYSSALRYELLGGERPVFGGTEGNALAVNQVSTPGTMQQITTGGGRGEETVNAYRGGTTAYNVGGQSFNNRGEADAYATANATGTGGTPYGGYEMTDAYKFQLDQGQRAIDNSAASSGGLFSGATLKAQQKYGQGIAAQGYDNYLNRLTGGAASGQAAAGNMANAGANYASGASNAYANIGNAQAAGAIGVGNALQGGIQNGIGIMNYQNMKSGGNANALSTPWASSGFWGQG